MQTYEEAAQWCDSCVGEQQRQDELKNKAVEIEEPPVRMSSRKRGPPKSLEQYALGSLSEDGGDDEITHRPKAPPPPPTAHAKKTQGKSTAVVEVHAPRSPSKIRRLAAAPPFVASSLPVSSNPLSEEASDPSSILLDLNITEADLLTPMVIPPASIDGYESAIRELKGNKLYYRLIC